jgi:hypothetical protein
MAATDGTGSPAARAPGPGLRAVEKLIEAAELAAASGHTTLSWEELGQWPDWALYDTRTDTWLQVLGACWHAPALQRCIDGARLAALREAFGDAALKAVLALSAPSPGPGLAPSALSASDSVAHWLDRLRADGQALALASLPTAALQQAVAAVLGWPGRVAAVPPPQLHTWLTIARA